MSDIYRRSQHMQPGGILLLICLILFIPGISQGAALASSDTALGEEISGLFAKDPYTDASYGILVSDLETGRDLILKDTEQLFVPGSVTKLFTAAALLETFGPDFRFETPVYSSGKMIDGSVLDGILILKASGDPNLGGRAGPNGTISFTDMDHGEAGTFDTVTLTPGDPLAGIREIARQVRASGIRQADNVVIDDRLFPVQRNEANPPVSPVIVNDNLIDLTITPTDRNTAASVRMRPETKAFIVNSSVVTVAKGDPEILIYDGKPGEIVVTGKIAEKSSPVNRTYTIRDPASFARIVLIEALEKEGVIITADTGTANPSGLLPPDPAYPETNRVATLISAPLMEEVKMTLKVSQNLHADTWVMLLAVHDGGTSMEDGMKAEQEALAALGIDTSKISLADGEGGVSADRLSPRVTNRLLAAVLKKPWGTDFLHALPSLGIDGTLADMVAGSDPAAGKVHAKTGTTLAGDYLNGRGYLLGKGLAGYMIGKSGTPLAFTIFLNNVPVTSISDLEAISKDLAGISARIQQSL